MKIKFLLLVILFLEFSLDAFTGVSQIVKEIRFESGTGAKQSFISVFGDQYTAARTPIVNILFGYGIPTKRVTISTIGIGSQVISNGGYLFVEGGTATTSSASIESNKSVNYAAGYETYVLFTAAWTGGTAANSTQWAGIFSSVNGFALGYNESSFSILQRNNNADLIVDQNSFNIDKLNGIGPSGIFLNPAKLNLFKISFGWVGSSGVLFSMMKDNGQWFPFHNIKLPGLFGATSLVNPSLPIKMEIKKTNSDDTNLTIKSSCWAGGILAKLNALSLERFSVSRFGFNPASNKEVPMLSIRVEENFKSQVNSNFIFPLLTNFAAQGQTAGFRVLLNPTLTGASFNSISSESSVFVDTSATAFSGGIELIALIIQSNTSQIFLYNTDNILADLVKGDILTVTVKPKGAGITADCSISFREAQ